MAWSKSEKNKKKALGSTGDGEVIDGFLRGSPEAAETVESWIGGALLAYRSQLTREDVRDLSQEVALALVEAFREEKFTSGSLSGYVRAFAHHKAIDVLRSRSRRHDEPISESDLPTVSPLLNEKLEQKDQVRIALEVVRVVGPECSQIWELLQRGMSYRQIGDATGRTEGAVRVRALRCRRKALAIRAELLRSFEKDRKSL